MTLLERCKVKIIKKPKITFTTEIPTAEEDRTFSTPGVMKSDI